MKSPRLIMNFFVSIAAAAATFEASAILEDRGRGLIFDTALGITWLQNANLPKSETFGLVLADPIYADGQMNWRAANSYVAKMNELKYLGYDNWRLPQIRPTQFGYDLRCVSYDGTTECGYNINDTRNELAHLFYSSLGNQSLYDINGNPNQPPAIIHGLFLNVNRSRYWTENELFLGSVQAFTFDFSSGLKEWDTKDPYYSTFVWAVRDGDVAVVPEPSSLLLLLAGLTGGTAYLRFRRVRAET